ncbi:MAG: S9 family peptidase [Lachnospiraceae bacterium]|jgi:dipeptidyl aminopeptidase/acylaminoacyl peptidase|nr:S9 family peptidase [Lachnospiraceae bacterium]
MKRLMIEDMDRLVYLSAPELRCDAGEVVYIASGARPDGAGFVSEARRLSLGPRAGQETIVVAAGCDLARYSPDGSRIACLSSMSGERQIWLWEEGQLRQLTKLRHGVSDFSWAPDGQSLLWEALLWPEETDSPFGEMTQEEKRVWEQRREREPIVVEELIYKLDETGLFDGSVHQIGVTGLDGVSRLLTRTPYEHRKPVLSPDGRTVVYYGYPDGSIHRLRAQIFALLLPQEDQDGDEEKTAPEFPAERQITHEDYLIDTCPLLFDPADDTGERMVALSYVKEEEGFLQLPQLFDLEKGSPCPLFEKPCPAGEINNLAVGRNAYGREGSPCAFDESGETFFFSAIWMGSQHIFGYERATGEFRCLTREGSSVQAFAAPKRGNLVFLNSTLLRPAELYRQEAAKSLPYRLTDENGWLSGYELSQPVAMDVPSADGRATIHGWYLKPAGLAEGERAPAVLDIHGGPDCSYTSCFWYEFQYLAAGGTAVVYCDPRGSIGYGPGHRAGDCAYGEEAKSDLLTFLDAVISLGFIDEKRCGVTGGSYGGYMTNRMITETDRFAAAVTQRTLCNLSTSYGTGDMGFVTGKKDFHSMLGMLKERVNSRTTTLGLVDRIHTPLLILHGTKDYRCSFEQSEQLFIAMKERNPQVPLRFVAFPGENHGLTREGSPWAQKAHLKEMADWFRIYLKAEEERDEETKC